MPVLRNFQFNEPAPSRGNATLMKGNLLAFCFVLASFCFGLKMGCLKLIQFWWLHASQAVKGAARRTHLVTLLPPEGKGKQTINLPYCQ